jgi:endoglucanase
MTAIWAKQFYLRSKTMRLQMLSLGSLLIMAGEGVHAATVAQPTSCIASQFSSSGDQYWKNITLKLTNNCTQPMDFQNSTVSFKSSAAINTSFWGNFGSLSYPDNNLTISSQPQGDGTHLATLNLHFPSYQGANSTLSVGGNIQIQYGAAADKHIEGSTNVYLSGSTVQTGSIVLSNGTTKPTNVVQTYALVHLTMNGQNVKNVQVPWKSTITVTGLASGAYGIAADAVKDSAGRTYQGTSVPSTVNVAPNTVAKSTINYALVQPTGNINIRLSAIPSSLSGYTGKPTVVLTQTQSGASVSKVVNWAATTTVSSLQAGSTYRFSTGAISYNGYNCAPTFSPTTAVANATTAPTTTLSYNCVQVAQDTITLNVTGAPTTLTSLQITLTPNNNTAPVTQTINLNNGSGNSTVLLTDGVIYTLSSTSVSGYNVSFSPQPLTATAGGTASITLTQNTGTPVGVNGQLTVCGNQLCNQQGTPIQLKGMSTHGLQWYGQGICVTSGSLDALSKNFKANVVRLALYVQEGGYETNPTKFTNEVNALINEATNRGMYVIVDWHILSPGDPSYNLEHAKKFFTDVASLNKNKNNIIYEIANEPNGVSWATIKSYANQIIPVIRAIDPKAPILIGTRAWSSLGMSEGATYQEIVNNPVNFPNIMYTFHFYAASHRDDYLAGLDNASKVLPIFVTEFGTQTYSGDGTNDLAMSDRYMQLMANKKIGWTNWNYSDDWRSGAIWKSGTCSQGAWTDSNLKESGIYIKNKIQAP